MLRNICSNLSKPTPYVIETLRMAGPFHFSIRVEKWLVKPKASIISHWSDVLYLNMRDSENNPSETP
jgi:hypothetical protein